MNGNQVGTTELRLDGGPDGVRLGCLTGLADRRHMIDINTQ
jgi:hypothetical protein